METALNHHSSHVISKQVLVPHRPAIFAGSLSEAAMLKDAAAMLLLKTTVNLQEQDLCFRLMNSSRETPGSACGSRAVASRCRTRPQQLELQRELDELTLFGPTLLSLFSANSASSQLLSSGSKTWFKAGANVLPCGYFLLTSYLQKASNMDNIVNALLNVLTHMCSLELGNMGLHQIPGQDVYSPRHAPCCLYTGC